VAQIARDPAQHTRVSGNSSTLFQREIETIEDDAIGHLSRVEISSYQAEYSDLQRAVPAPAAVPTDQACSNVLRKRSMRAKYWRQVSG
jgi:hypothetical protein